MILSEISVKRPVFACVISLLLIAFGLVAFERIPLREYPNIDPPIVNVDVNYPGAPASVVETRITKVIEERIAGVEGIRFIESSSQDGESDVTIEFNIDRDINAAANDIRDRISGVSDNLPEEAEPPEVQKADSGDDVIVWFNLVSDRMTVPELSDYADRYLVDRFSTLNGVARVRVGGAQSYALRIWIDRQALAARNLTVDDIENALRSENVELPAGSLESKERLYKARVERTFRDPADFNNLVLGQGSDGYLVRLGDVARVERGLVESRTIFRGNGIPQVGIGIIKQSNANTINVARAAQQEVERINMTLPDGMSIEDSYDSSVFVENAIKEVYKTLLFAMVCVILVIYAFLGNIRATIIPALTLPVSVVATFTVLYAFDFTVNMLTLLALVLAIGLVVDDAIVMLENIFRRMDEKKEPPLLAAFEGSKQVGFAIVATTLVLISVFLPITFLEGDVGRLFTEFAITMAAAVAFSSLVALTLSPMLASKFLKPSKNGNGKAVTAFNKFFDNIKSGYVSALGWFIRKPLVVLLVFAGLFAATTFMYRAIPTEYAPQEDRGAFFISVTGPEGATFEYISEYMNVIEDRLLPYTESGEVTRLLVRAPRGFGSIENFNSGFVIVVLNEWSKRRPARDIMNEMRMKLADLPGVRAFPIMRQAFGGGTSDPVQFVIGGGTYEQLAEYRDILLEKIREDNPGLTNVESDYKETRPQLDVKVDYQRASDLGVNVRAIGRTLESMMAGRRVTTYLEEGEEYDVILEGKRDELRTLMDMKNIYVRSDRTRELIPLSNLVSIESFAAATELSRYNRVRAITISAGLEEGYRLGDALEYLRTLVRDNLPDDVVIDYKGQSRDFYYSGSSIIFVFLLGLVVVFLVLAAQFESFIHPVVIMATVPLAIGGGLFGLWLTESSLNIYSQIGLIMLVGLSAKNGILIVEFANQLRDQGMRFDRALLEASGVRLRPILMTGLTTAAGAIPLILASGAGAETRIVIGVVILAGVLAATVFTLFIVPVAYSLIARRTGAAGDVARELDRLKEQDAA